MSELERISVEQHQLKMGQAEKEKSYYLEKVVELGLESMDRFVKYCPFPSKYMKLGLTFAHKDIEIIAKAIADNKPWAVVSGLNPSGPLHLGHKVIFDELLWMQKHGAEVYIPITNDESFVVGKTNSLAEARKIAYEEVIPSIIAMGFDSEKTNIYVDSDYPDIYNVAMDLANKTTLNKAFKIFGFDKTEKGENPGTLFYRSAVQVAQILLPQYPEFGGPKPTVVPVGVDQHPYISLSRDVAKKKGFIPPAELITKFLWGLDGKGKMAASRENSAIFLTQDPENAGEALRLAYTGGSPTASFQQEYGGISEICPVWSLRTHHFEADNKVQEECSSGQVLCNECKEKGTESMIKYLENHQNRLEEARIRMDEYILKTPITSIFEVENGQEN